MQDPTTGRKITLVAELSRIYLRFINVNDDSKLTGILSKILQSLLLVYMEDDMVNADIANNPKIAQLDEIMQHLTTRVTYSQVKAPVTQILNIVNTPEWARFENNQIKTKVLGLVYGFIKPYS